MQELLCFSHRASPDATGCVAASTVLCGSERAISDDLGRSDFQHRGFEGLWGLGKGVQCGAWCCVCVSLFDRAGVCCIRSVHLGATTFTQPPEPQRAESEWPLQLLACDVELLRTLPEINP